MRALDTFLLHLRQVTYKFTPSLPPKCHSAFLSGAGGVCRTERGHLWSKFLLLAVAAREREGARPVDHVPRCAGHRLQGAPDRQAVGPHPITIRMCPASV